MHPETDFSAGGAQVLAALVYEHAEARLIASACALLNADGHGVSGGGAGAERDVVEYLTSATRRVLPGELAKHGVSEGTEAVTKFSSNVSEGDHDGWFLGVCQSQEPLTLAAATSPAACAAASCIRSQ